MSGRSELFEKLEEFISKHYKNLLLKGVIYFFSVFVGFFILFSVGEYYGQFNTLIRTFLFWAFSVFNLFVLWKWVVIPLIGLYRIGQSLDYFEAAKIIGNHFSSVEDKLVNLLQLQELSEDDNALIEASIQQKINQLKPIPFTKAIDLRANKVYLKYAIAPIAVLIILFLSGNKNMVLESSSRIISYNTEYLPVAPFDFIIDNTSLQVVKGDDFQLYMHYEGSEIPKSSQIMVGDNVFDMKKEAQGEFSYLFKNPQNSSDFRFTSNGFTSSSKTLTVVPKPFVVRFTTELVFPTYIKKTNETLENTGNLNIPEGTRVKWLFYTENSDEVFMQFNESEACERTSESAFSFQKRFVENTAYSLFTKNNFVKGDSISYQISVFADEYPNISVETTVDSINEMLHYFDGVVQDDYGILKLTFNYQLIEGDSSKWQQVDIVVNPSNNEERFFVNYNFADLGLAFGQGMNYYFEVWDNDGINGNKSTKSSVATFQAASIKELEQQSDSKNNELKADISESKKLAEEIQKELEELQKQLLKSKELSWEDKQKTNALLEKQNELKNKIDKIQKQQKKNSLQEKQYKSPKNELLKKQEEIQRLFESLMDEEMEKMMDELKDMMDDIKKEDLQKALEDMQKSDEDIEKELDRTLELFKQMEVEQKLEKNIDNLKKLAEKQKELSEKKDDKEALKQEQENLQKEFEDIQKDLEKAKEMNDKLEYKQDIPNTKPAEEEIKNDMQKSVDQLEKNMKKQAGKSQKSAAEKMEEMSQSLQSAMQSAEQEQVAEDMQTLRQILENLIVLSVDQENILKTIPQININSPLYLDYLQLQKKLQTDAQIIEDSLFALSKRQPQIESIVNKEINTINLSTEKALEEMAERRSAKASERQQFAMTSANNLALILSETLEQMQKEMANMESKPSSKMCNKPNSSGGEGMKEMKQKQKQVKEQMKQMLQSKDGKNGKSNKGLAKLAAQQEMIRNRMSELRDELGNDKNGKNNLDQLINQMEENEVDIINDNITLESIRRQETIMSRLLEAEKAERERDEEEKRESTEWMNDLSKRLVNPYEEYQKEKEKQQELLRTMPPSFTPFYKQKVKEYFNENGQ
ncbi:MAG: hypothetical protein ISR00_05805 [Flavobacteriales bacterium]|nr:hypothetical protein [Flavobacteriales bacterium]